MNRRGFIAMSAAATIPGCSGLDAGLVTPTTAQVQTWAVGIVNALVILGQGVIADGVVTGQRAAALQVAMDDVQRLLAAVLDSGASGDVRGAVSRLIMAVGDLRASMPLPPDAAVAVGLGIAVLTAFVAGSPMAVPAVPATLHRVAQAAQE